MKIIDADAFLAIYKRWISQLSDLKEYEGDKRGVETCIAVLEEAPTIDPTTLAPRWVSVEERLPNHYETVLCHKKRPYKGDIMILVWDKVGRVWLGEKGFYHKEEITYWQSLPEPPKEGENHVV